MKKNVALLTVILVLTLVFAGCGSKDGKIKDITGTSADISSVMTALADYEKMEVTAEAMEPTAEELAYQREASPYVYKQIEGKTVVEAGDVVNIDYRGLMDGEAFEGGTSAGYDLEIGSNSFIEGFEDQLIGKELGGDYELELTFPEDYWNEDMAGVDVVFEVHINAIQELVEATDEELAETVRTQKLQQAVLNMLIANSEFTLDEEEVQLQYETTMEQYEAIGQMVGGMDVYLNYMGMTQEVLEATVRGNVENMVKAILIIDEVARLEELATEEEISNGALEDGTLLDQAVMTYLVDQVVVK